MKGWSQWTKFLIRTHTAALQELGFNMNLMIKLYKINKQGLENEKKVQQHIKGEYFKGKALKHEIYMMNTEALFQFHSRLLDAQHKYLIAKAYIDKTLMRAPYYDGLFELVPAKKTRHRLDLVHKLENMRIERAMERRKIQDLSDPNSFEVD